MSSDLNENLFFYLFVFFFNDTSTTELYTLSLHDALPIYAVNRDDHESARALVDLGNHLEACFFWTEDADEESFIEGEGV